MACLPKVDGRAGDARNSCGGWDGVVQVGDPVAGYYAGAMVVLIVVLLLRTVPRPLRDQHT